MTTPAEAKRTALLAVPSAAGIAMVDHVYRNRNASAQTQVPPSRIIAGALVALIILTAAANRAPGLVSGFAVLLVISSLTTSGVGLFGSINANLSPKAGKGAGTGSKPAAGKGAGIIPKGQPK